MYLTKLELDPHRRHARKFLGSPQAMHAVVAKATEGTTRDSEGRVLWRIDRTYSSVSLYILSPQAPNGNGVMVGVTGCGAVGLAGRGCDAQEVCAGVPSGCGAFCVESSCWDDVGAGGS